MRYMMLVKADETYEKGGPPSPELEAAMGKLCDDGFRAGHLLEVGGLLPTSEAVRVYAKGGRLSVTDGPFTEAKELVGGYAIVRAASRAEAIEHGKVFMQLHVDVLGPAYEGQLEIRPMWDPPEGA